MLTSDEEEEKKKKKNDCKVTEMKGEIESEEDFRRKANWMIEQCQELYESEWLAEAMQILIELEAFIDDHKDQFFESAEQLKVTIATNDLLRLIRSEYEQVIEVELHITQDLNWVKVRESENLSTFYRIEPGTSIHSLKTIGIVNAPLLDIIAVVHEVDLLPSFFTALPISVEVLKEITRFRKLVYSQVGLMWPFSDRDVVSEARGVDLLEEKGYIVIVGNSCEEFPGVEVPETPNGCKRVDIRLAGGILTPLSENRTLISSVANLDFRVSLPKFLINFLAHHLTYYGFVQFKNQCEKLEGSEYENRIQQNPDFYNEVKERIDKQIEKISAKI